MIIIKEIKIRLYEPSDFSKVSESPTPYCNHSWLDIEVDGEVQTHLSEVAIKASALTPVQVLADSCEWEIDVDAKKTLRS